MPLDENIAGFLKFIEAMGHPPFEEGTVDQAREGLTALMVGLRDEASLPVVGSVENITIADGIPGRVYRPAGSGPFPTVVYYHGGGFVIGDLDTHDGICRLLSNDVGAVVVSVAYSLAPEHHFPRAVEDAYLALAWVAEHIDDFGGDAARLAVGGDSAGGNLSAVCAQLAKVDGPALAAQLLVYPAVDLLGDYPSREQNAEGYFLTLGEMRWFAEHYLGVAETSPETAALAVDPRLSPLLAADLSGLPPAVVVTAEFDPLRDEGDAYAEALLAAGVKVEHRQFPGLIHGFYGLERLSPSIAEATAWTNGALRALIG